MNSFSEFIQPCLDDWLPIVRELLTYDAMCPTCLPFKRGPNQELTMELVPSPLHWSRQTEYPWAITHAMLEPHHKCLDIAGGWSVLKYAVAKRAASVVSMDWDQEPEGMIKASRTTDLFQTYNVSHVLGDARRLPFPGNYFDRIFSISVMEHVIGEHLKCLHEIDRVLKPGGCALITMDICVGEVGKDNFLLGMDDARVILESMNIPFPQKNPYGAVYMREENVHLTVLLIRYVKGIKDNDDHNSTKSGRQVD